MKISIGFYLFCTSCKGDDLKRIVLCNYFKDRFFSSENKNNKEYHIKCQIIFETLNTIDGKVL